LLLNTSLLQRPNCQEDSVQRDRHLRWLMD
jgi:hypothetical protein